MTDISSPPPLLASPPATKSKFRLVLLTLLVVLILLILGGTGYFALMQRDMLIRLSELEMARVDTLSEVKTLRNTLSLQSSAQADALTLHAESVQKLDQQNTYLTQQLAQLASGTRADWLLAEAEYLMRLANQRMNLERDTRGAEAMLHTADQVLAEIADPNLFQVREQLAREILAIQTVQPVDREQTFAQLQALTELLTKIEPGQFSNRTKQGPADSAPARDPKISLWDGIKADFLRLFHIQRLDQPIAPLMAPEQSYYLQQNLQLMLEQASHALVSQEPRIYQSSLKKAEQWLKQYFDDQNPFVQSMHASLSSLKNARIRNEPVNIAESLHLLRQHIEKLQRQHLLTPNLAPVEVQKTGDTE